MELSIDIDQTLGIVDPKLHGQFIEFLGECIDQGIWVGPDSKIPNIHGFRKTIVEKMQALHPAVIRWPGGCYADSYHWRDGIGPRKQRPITFNENFGTFTRDDHQFGTDEFMEFCELVGAEPWINISLMSGTVQEMKDWMEYCNRESGTDLARLRAQNGHPAPYHVKYWGIGNEVWAGGGFMTPAAYAAKYREFATAMPSFKHDPFDKEKIYRIASGPDGNKPIERVNWTRDLLNELAKYRQPSIQGLDLHYYNWNLADDDTPTEFDKQSWDRVVKGAGEIEEVIVQQGELINQGLAKMPTPESSMDQRLSKLELIVGEWGVWHRDAFTAKPALKQQVTMREAVATAITLNVLQRHCDLVKMATVAQSVNVLNALFLTEDEKTIMTPNYDVFVMYQRHQNGRLIQLPAMNSEKLDVMATIKQGQLTVTIINNDYAQSHQLILRLSAPATMTRHEELSAASPNEYNSAAAPDRVRTRTKAPTPFAADVFALELPNASVSQFQFQMN